jgi:hypothetical protein
MDGQVLPIAKVKIPAVIYKYRSFDNPFHQTALFKQELYLPSANEFNDPYDSNMPFAYREEEMTEENIFQKLLILARLDHPGKDETFIHQAAYNAHQERRFNDENHLDRIDEQIFQNVCNTFGILSLTPDCRNLLMWSYYGNSHKGFCIGYDSKYLVSCGLFGMGGAVRYSEDFPKLSLFEKAGMLSKMYYAKSKVWEHEKEYRLLHNYKRGKMHILPKEAISEVVLGCRLTDSERMKYAAAIMKELPHASIFQIERNKKKFSLSKTPVVQNDLLLNFPANC